jgi:hypothetical protein
MAAVARLGGYGRVRRPLERTGKDAAQPVAGFIHRDQVGQGHWLALQGMGDVPVIDDVTMPLRDMSGLSRPYRRHFATVSKAQKASSRKLQTSTKDVWQTFPASAM